MRIPFYKPEIDKTALFSMWNEAIDNGWLTTGPLTRKLEQKLAEFLRCEEIVCVSSATAGLQIALRLLGLKPGSRVALSVNTFVSAFEVILNENLIPVLIDIDGESLNMNLNQLEKFSANELACVMAVPFAGMPLPMKQLQEICLKNNWPLILDNAHALESTYQNKPVQSFCDMAVYSFYATKNLTSAEGGAIYCKDPQMAARARTMALHGLSRESWQRYSGGGWRYDVAEFGFKANLTDIHSAIALAQVDSLKDKMERRKILWSLYCENLRDIPEIKFQSCNDKFIESARHLFIIQVSSKKRDHVVRCLNENGIGTSLHFIPLHLFSAIRSNFAWKEGDFPVVEQYFAGCLSLPFYPQLLESELKEITSIIRNAVVG
ncbi:MAG: DegT/DnrJ/EryC1/StrS aminotransferase family protein [Leptospiraceae bacterium]|nr:DegT/DnrJ/EryC1/StrS aminotransferase family protein [Leptospiraceae bacterium]